MQFKDTIDRLVFDNDKYGTLGFKVVVSARNTSGNPTPTRVSSFTKTNKHRADSKLRKF